MKKIKLEKLTVKSFNTGLKPLNMDTVKGGRFHQIPETQQEACASDACASVVWCYSDGCTVFC